jgi:hypothetical protein
MPLLMNFAAFQAGWFACILGAANGRPWLGVGIVALAVGLHMRAAPRRDRESYLILGAAVLGTLLDSVVVAAGWIDYASGTLMPGVAPYWIAALWVLFATTLNVSLRWLHGRYVLAAALAAGFAPVSYLAAESLGALVITNRPAALLSLAALWALALPALFALARRLDGQLADAPARGAAVTVR